MKGSWKRVSPDEVVFAAITRVARDISEGVSEDDLKKWRQMFLSITARFELLDTDDKRHFRATNLRLKVAADFEALARSDIQQCFSVMAFQARKSKKGSCGAKELFQLYKKNALMVGSSDIIKEGFIDVCLTVWDKILANEKMRNVILHGEAKFGKNGPWKSIFRLQKVIDVARSEEQRMWLVAALGELCDENIIKGATLRMEDLVGKNRSEKGLLHLLLMKLELLNWFCQRWVISKPFAEDVRKRMSQLNRGHAAYHSLFGTSKTAASMDISWLGSLPPSGQSALRLVESVVYKCNEWDTNLKTWVRANKNLEDIIQQPVLKETIENIEELLNQELSAKTASSSSGPKSATKIEDGKLKEALNIDDVIDLDPDDPRIEVEKLLREQDPDNKIGEYRDLAATKRNEQIKMLMLPSSATDFKGMLMGTAVHTVLQNTKNSPGYVGVMYNPAMAGEPSTHPHIRVCPLREDHLKMLIKGGSHEDDILDRKVCFQASFLLVCFRLHKAMLTTHFPCWFEGFANLCQTFNYLR